MIVMLLDSPGMFIPGQPVKVIEAASNKTISPNRVSMGCLLWNAEHHTRVKHLQSLPVLQALAEGETPLSVNLGPDL
jgi:hypothetical protein